jgi:cytochrome P450
MSLKDSITRPFDNPRPDEYVKIPSAIKRAEAKNLTLPPGPHPLTSDWLTLTFTLDTPRFLESMRIRHGDICSFFLARQLFIGVFSAQGAYEVTVSKQHHFVKGVGFDRMRKVLGEGLLTNEEPIHMQHRRAMQPPFHHGNLDVYVALMDEIVRKRIASWDEEISLSHEMMALTLEIVCQCLFGMESSKYTARIAKAMEIAIDRIERTMLPGLDRFDSTKVPYFTAFAKASDELVEIADEIIQARIASKDNRKDDLLGILLSMQDQISLTHIRDEVLTLILSGHETTANVLTWAFAYLSENLKWQRGLHDEALRADFATAPTYQSLEAMSPIASAILDEALRLAPPVWVAPRIAIEDVEIDGIRVPKGAHVLVSQFVTQRDPRYFADPERFDPERWLNTDLERNLPKGAFFPFGAGSRKCLGEYFALAESRLILLHVAKSVVLATKFPKAQPRATYRPKGKVLTQVSRY